MNDELTEKRIIKIQYDVNRELRQALADIANIANDYAILSASKSWKPNIAIEQIGKRAKRALDYLDCKGAILDELKTGRFPKEQQRL